MGRLADTPSLPVGLLGRRRRKTATGAGASWWDHARCLGMNPDLFHPPQGQAVRAEHARAICWACPVRLDCLAWALVTREELGIWGATTERQRRDVRDAVGLVDDHELPLETVRLRLGAMDADEAHGTAAMHAAGCRCAPCRLAARIDKTDAKLNRRTA